MVKKGTPSYLMTIPHEIVFCFEIIHGKALAYSRKIVYIGEPLDLPPEVEKGVV